MTIERRPGEVVFIDTLQRIRPPSKPGAGMYESDSNFLSEIQTLALEFDAMVMCLHHVRKATSKDPFEMVSGSNGLMGVADCTIVIDSPRGSTERTMHIIGRDVDEMSLAMTFDNGRWDMLGDASQVRIGKERQQILDTLKAASEPMTPKQVADILGKSRSNVNKLLLKLQTEGHVISEDGIYSIPDTKTADICVDSVTPVTAVTAIPPFTVVPVVTPVTLFTPLTGQNSLDLGVI